MRVIGVLDLARGHAVHARGGVRDCYAPVRSVAGAAIAAGDPLHVARVYTECLGVQELYVADLDAILGGPSQDATISQLAALGVPLWLDAGVSSASRARHALSLGAAHVIVGLETLDSYAALDEICAAVGGHRVAFSLDLRGGTPLAAPGEIAVGEPPPTLALRAARAGTGALIVIDLARVGAGTGLDVGLIADLREIVPDVTLVAGGGIRGPADLEQLAETGCDGVLVATALHDGRIGSAAVATAHRHRRSRR